MVRAREEPEKWEKLLDLSLKTEIDDEELEPLTTLFWGAKQKSGIKRNARMVDIILEDGRIQSFKSVRYAGAYLGVILTGYISRHGSEFMCKGKKVIVYPEYWQLPESLQERHRKLYKSGE